MAVAIIPIGGEQHVGSRRGLMLGRGNETTPIAPTQAAASASPLSDGRVIVVYEGETGGVFARIVRRDGSASPEISVDAHATASSASVAVWADGTFVVVYIRSMESRPTIFARIYHQDGSPVYSVPMPISKNRFWFFRAFKVSAPTVTALPENYRCVVAWSDGVTNFIRRTQRSFVSFCVYDGQSVAAPAVITTAGQTSSKSSEYNACVQIVQVAPSVLAWTYQSDKGDAHSQLQVIGGTYISLGLEVGQNYPSIASLGPNPYENGHFSYVIASHSVMTPPTPDLSQVINYEVWDAWRNSPLIVSTLGRRGSKFGIANQVPRPFPVPAFSKYPAVAGLVEPHADKFVISWSEGGNISARVFTNSGVPLSNETTIVGVLGGGDGVNAQAKAQSIVATPYGGFYVVWMKGVFVGDKYEYDIAGRHYQIVMQ
jgi:hypothetical protein